MTKLSFPNYMKKKRIKIIRIYQINLRLMKIKSQNLKKLKILFINNKQIQKKFKLNMKTNNH